MNNNTNPRENEYLYSNLWTVQASLGTNSTSPTDDKPKEQIFGETHKYNI